LVTVKLEDVTKRYGSTLAVDGVSLEVRDKEFFVLLGPSGCGKSTTLNMIAGLEDVTSGNIYFDHQVVNEIPPEKRDVAMVFQSFALYPNLSAFDNIAFPLRIRKLPKEEIRRKVHEAADMLRIRGLLEKRPYELSGGEKQRVALARAIVREPKLFLLDEPLSNVDAKLRVYMRAELIRLQKDLKTTTVYVTHDQVEAMTMGDRTAVMNLGKVIQIGDPMGIFKKPANLFVAGFIGTPPMNFFDCSLKASDGRDFLDSGYFSLELDKELARMIRGRMSGSELVVGVRPHDLKVGKDRLSRESFEAEVYAVEPLGTETVVDLKIGENIHKAIVPPSFGYGIGEKVWADIVKEGIHVFDKKTEAALV